LSFGKPALRNFTILDRYKNLSLQLTLHAFRFHAILQGGQYVQPTKQKSPKNKQISIKTSSKASSPQVLKNAQLHGGAGPNSWENWQHWLYS